MVFHSLTNQTFKGSETERSSWRKIRWIVNNMGGHSQRKRHIPRNCYGAGKKWAPRDWKREERVVSTVRWKSGASRKGPASLESLTCCFWVEKEAWRAQEGHGRRLKAVTNPTVWLKVAIFHFSLIRTHLHRPSLIITSLLYVCSPTSRESLLRFVSFCYFVAIWDVAWQLCSEQLLKRDISLRPFIFIGTGHARVLITVPVYKFARH